MSKGAAVLAALLLALAASAAGTLALGARPPAAQERQAEEFQRLVGGLGFGPAQDLEPCANALDPRLDSCCPNDVGPVPGGMLFCPYHACSILDYPPLEGPAGCAPTSPSPGPG